MKPPFFKRVKRAVKREFRRIRDEHRRTGRSRNKPPLAFRLRHWFKRTRESGFKIERRRPPKQHGPPLSKRIRYNLHKIREKYKIVLSSNYLIITLNSTVLYLFSFFLVHFFTHLVTSLTAYYCEISTTINYTMVDFHIRYWDWTPEMVITVFSVPSIFAIIVALLASLAFVRKIRKPAFFTRIRYLTKKQRYKHKREKRKKEIDIQVQRLQNTAQPEVRHGIKKRFSWQARLFLLWTMYHCLNYFFSGILYSFLFHRRFGYVTWYAFDSFIFDALFSVAAFLLLLMIGYAFSAQFLYSGRMYLNELSDRNRMPFVLSQAIFPFIAGTVITILFQIPVFDPALILLNFSVFFLLLPLPSRAARFDNIHFDRHEKPVKIYWNWVAWSSIVVIAILVAVKVGIPIKLP